ncbi:polysaccharide deacetylase [Hydrogenivirga sp. 128-5-R1-1]|nr:polysaccharide deacetylase [Hydrogenivirga sp. 128-5-R1-1]
MADEKGYAVILIYHKFDEPKSPSTSVPIEDFKKQMRYLYENNYNVVSLDKLLQYIKNKNIPPKTIVITIDDGYKSTMKAFKVLKRYNFPFTVFLYMEGVGVYPDYLTKKQINELKKYPYITFGNHSFSHRHFAKVSKKLDKEKYVKNFIEDTLKAEEKFKKLIGYKPKFYAYPYGDYNEILTNVLKNLGYKAAFTQDPASFSYSYDLYTVPRQPIVGHWGNLKHFIKVLNMKPLEIKNFYPKYGILTKNPPDKIEAKVRDLSNYKNCGIYVSELGWLKPEIKGNILYVNNLPSFKRWKNRIGFTCFEKSTDKQARFFYMIINPQ